MAHKTLYRSSRVSIVMIVLIMVLYILNTRMLGSVPLDEEQVVRTFLGQWLWEMESLHPLMMRIVAAVLMIVGSILTMQLTIWNSLYGRAIHTPAIIYLLVIATLATPHDLVAPQIAAILVMMAFRKIYNGYNNDLNPSFKLFTGCFLLGMIPVLYPASLPLMLLVFFIMMLFERYMREAIMTFIATLLPLSIEFYLRWLNGVDLGVQLSEYWAIMIHRESMFSVEGIYTLPTILYAVGISILSIIGINKLSIALVARKKIIFASMTVILGVFMLAIPCVEPQQFAILATPIAITMTAALLERRPIFANILYSLFILASLVALVLP